jgi:hypothetical protein
MPPNAKPEPRRAVLQSAVGDRGAGGIVQFHQMPRANMTNPRWPGIKVKCCSDSSGMRPVCAELQPPSAIAPVSQCDRAVDRHEANGLESPRSVCGMRYRVLGLSAKPSRWATRGRGWARSNAASIECQKYRMPEVRRMSSLKKSRVAHRRDVTDKAGTDMVGAQAQRTSRPARSLCIWRRWRLA